MAVRKAPNEQLTKTVLRMVSAIHVKIEQEVHSPRNLPNDGRVGKVGHRIPAVDDIDLNIVSRNASILSYQYKVSATKMK